MFDKERMFREMRRGLLDETMHPIKRAVIGIFLEKIESKHLEMTKDLMRGWRPLVDSHGEPMQLRSAVLAYDDLRSSITVEVLDMLLKQIPSYRGLVYDLVVDGQDTFCGAIFTLKLGSLLVVFPRLENTRQSVMAFVMGDEDRENDAPECRYVGREIFAALAESTLSTAK